MPKLLTHCLIVGGFRAWANVMLRNFLKVKFV
jgi:hypothetical protein